MVGPPVCASVFVYNMRSGCKLPMSHWLKIVDRAINTDRLTKSCPARHFLRKPRDPSVYHLVYTDVVSISGLLAYCCFAANHSRMKTLQSLSPPLMRMLDSLSDKAIRTIQPGTHHTIGINEGSISIDLNGRVSGFSALLTNLFAGKFASNRMLLVANAWAELLRGHYIHGSFDDDVHSWHCIL